MHSIAVLFVLLTFATQAVFCFFKFVNYLTPEQCGPFVVDFSGSSDPPVLPLSLTIVPFSANPISIQLPMDSWDNSSNAGTARITFLPFSSGTQFVASLDDGTGAGVSLVSDVTAVKDSNITTCLAPNQKETNYYQVHGNLSQCSRFNVTFDPSVIQQVPSIRAFLPRSFSFSINATDDPIRLIMPGQHSNQSHGSDDGSGNNKDGNDNNNSTNSRSNNSNGRHGIHNLSSKEYLLSIIHGFQAVLTFDDGEGHRETSKLFTAGGTATSSSNCFKGSFNAPSRTPDASSSATSHERRQRLSRTSRIVIIVLGAGVVISLAVIFFILCRKRRKARKDLEKTSFVFTEDVDMGSSFVSRMRARISHLTYGKRSFRSYHSYRDEKDGASTYIPTSPIGSPALHEIGNVLPQSEKRQSWVEIDAGCDNLLRITSGLTTPERVVEGHSTLPIIEFDTFAPLYSTEARTRSLKSDVPVPAISRSSESSRFLLGSGYLSSRSSRTDPITADGRLKISVNRLSVPIPIIKPGRAHPDSAIAISTDISSLGYLPSRSSNMTTDPEDNGIFVSSPIRPSLEFPTRPPTYSDSHIVERPSAPVIPDAVRGWRYSMLRVNLRRDNTRKERGRILPFQTSSLRTSRSSQQ